MPTKKRAKFQRKQKLKRREKARKRLGSNVKPLPPELIERLKRIADHIVETKGKQALYHSFERLENLDHRKDHPDRQKILSIPAVRDSPSIAWGGRIRGIDTSRNFPKVKFVVKRDASPYGSRGKTVLEEIKDRVRTHNRNLLNEKRDYILETPLGYDIGHNLVVIPWIDKPNVSEILDNTGFNSTARGKKYFAELKKRYGVTEEQLRRDSEKINKALRLDYDGHNLLLAGVKNGKLVFRPLVDIE